MLSRHKMMLIAIAVSLTAATAGSSTSSRAADATQTPQPTATATTEQPKVYWGALINADLYGFDTPPLDQRGIDMFESHARKPMSILSWGQPWADHGRYYEFYENRFDTIRSRGSIPALDWRSYNYFDGSEVDQPDYSLRAIISGKHDVYIKRFAMTAKAWGHPFFLRFDCEMNGNWYPWSELINGNHAGEFVQAWRHIHDIFTGVGATNATWVWSPSVVTDSTIPLKELYPGNAYVDWVAIDGYNWGTNPKRPLGWKPFYTVMKETYDQLQQLAPQKPVMIGEMGSTEYGGSKANWITDALTIQLPQNFPNVKAVIYFNSISDDMDWVIETSPAAQEAFADAIGLPYFAPNRFGGLDTSPIPPLSPLVKPTTTQKTSRK